MEKGPVNIKTTPKAQLDLRTGTSFRFLYKCGEPSDRGLAAPENSQSYRK